MLALYHCSGCGKGHPTDRPAFCEFQGAYLHPPSCTCSTCEGRRRHNRAAEDQARKRITEFQNQYTREAERRYGVLATSSPSGRAVWGREPVRPRLSIRQRFTEWWCSHASEFARGIR